MLIENDLLPYIHRLIRFSTNRYLSFHPLRWDADANRVYAPQNYHFGYIVTAVLLLTASQSTISLVKFDTVQFKAIQAYFCLILVVFASIHWFYISYSSETAQFINGLINFERKYGCGQRCNARFLKILCDLQYYSLPILVFLLSFTAALAPDSPFNSYNIFYHSISPPPILSIKGVFTFISVLTSNAALWSMTIPVLNFVMTCNFVMAFAVLSTLPWTFHRLVLLSAVRGFNPLSKAFHKHTKLSNAALSYREFQLLCYLYNDIHQQFITQPFALSSISSQIVFLFLLVVYNTKENPIIFFFSIMIIMNAVIIDVVCYGQAANVHATSELVKQKLRSRNTLWNNIWFRKFLNSCPTVGVGFFMNTYFGKLTPLNVEFFCLDKAAILMLLTR
ncbi:unnamed protein product [Orchesella dallaii]|uniref:Odorant receptor n=1 Tax=Orchesella dallaii TaxID=48710 RepID=A0ABP1RDN0_9HEXA